MDLRSEMANLFVYLKLSRTFQKTAKILQAGWNLQYDKFFHEKITLKINLKVGCLHPVACTRSGSGFPSNATLV
jgi:hypothetical protein